MTCNLFKGFEVGRDKIEYSRLPFEDDILFFMGVEEQWLRNFCLKQWNLFKVLDVFCLIPSFHINMSMSLLLGIHVNIKRLA